VTRPLNSEFFPIPPLFPHPPSPTPRLLTPPTNPLHLVNLPPFPRICAIRPTGPRCVSQLPAITHPPPPPLFESRDLLRPWPCPGLPSTFSPLFPRCMSNSPSLFIPPPCLPALSGDSRFCSSPARWLGHPLPFRLLVAKLSCR